MKRYSPEVDYETYCPDVEATMVDDEEGYYVEVSDVCDLLTEILYKQLDKDSGRDIIIAELRTLT